MNIMNNKPLLFSISASLIHLKIRNRPSNEKVRKLIKIYRTLKMEEENDAILAEIQNLEFTVEC